MVAVHKVDPPTLNVAGSPEVAAGSPVSESVTAFPKLVDVGLADAAIDVAALSTVSVKLCVAFGDTPLDAVIVKG
jgi:hypothetical protein